jgi:hypothetical protein
VRKSRFDLTDARRAALHNRYGGFRRVRARAEPHEAESDWATSFRDMGVGKPGLSVEHPTWGADEHCSGIKTCAEGAHNIVYRNHEGRPIAFAGISRNHYCADHQCPRIDMHVAHGGSPQYEVHSMAARVSSKGIGHAIAVGHIANHLSQIGVKPSSVLTGYSQRLVSHGLHLQEDNPEKGAKIKDYLNRRAARVQKGLFHSTTEPHLKVDDKYGGFHAGTLRAALDRTSNHCLMAGGERGHGSEARPGNRHEHYIVRAKPKLQDPKGNFKEPSFDELTKWGDRSTVYRNLYEHPGSRSVYAAKPTQEVRLGRSVRIPDHIVSAHKEGGCPPRCIHERLTAAIVRRAGL